MIKWNVPVYIFINCHNLILIIYKFFCLLLGNQGLISGSLVYFIKIPTFCLLQDSLVCFFQTH